MSFLGTTRIKAGFDLVPRPLAARCRALIRRVAELTRAISGRRVLANLARLDDHMLKDIGLSRSDLSDAAALPFLSDPTTKLLERAAERRAARRAVARAIETSRGSLIRHSPDDQRSA